MDYYLFMNDREPKYVRKYFWTHYAYSGFPNRVGDVCAYMKKRCSVGS